MGCLKCGRGFHQECKKCRKGKCHSEAVETKQDVQTKRHRGGQVKLEDHKDPLSTGRKRAAKLYPMDKTKPCQWRGLKNAGGGRYPIIGCINGKQIHRHHGPIKNPLENQEGNVHLICGSCHNRWHELNDVTYNEHDNLLLPHRPVPATERELFDYEIEWKSGAIGQRFTLKSSVEGVASRKALATED